MQTTQNIPENYISTHNNVFHFKNRVYDGVYLHGQLETDMGYDLFIFEKPVKLEYKMTEMILNGKLCNIYLWPSEYTTPKYRGLVVYANDYDANKYASEKFLSRAQNI